jgi:hypothetical protein
MRKEIEMKATKINKVEFYVGRDLDLILEALETYTDNLDDIDLCYAYQGIIEKIQACNEK